MTSRALRILVAAGPTHESIDAVRYLANRSSGRMGIALADAAVERNCEVTLLLGPVSGDPGPVWRMGPRFRSTEDLARLLEEQLPRHDCLLMAAAVADYRPVPAGPGKIRRGDQELMLRLEPTPDLLARAAASRTNRQFLVGFALESEEELDASARSKLVRKGVDAIVANPLGTMDSPTIDGRLYLSDGSVLRPSEAGAMDKRRFAEWLMDALLPRIRRRAAE